MRRPPPRWGRVLRFAAAGWMVGWALACGMGPEDQIRFVEPVRVPVPAGTLLDDVAAAHRVEPDILRLWNGLDGDEVEADTVLFVWREPPREASLSEVVAAAEPAPSAPPTRGIRRTPAPRSAPAPSKSQPPMVVVDQAAVVGDAPEVGRVKVTLGERPSSVRSAGLLGALSGMDEDGLEDDLASSVAGLNQRGSAPGTAGLSQRGNESLAGGGTAEGLGDIGRKPQTRVGPAVPDTPVRPPALRRPSAKMCRPAPTAAQLRSDDGMLTNQGLSAAQIKSAMGAFVRHTTACIPPGTKGTYEIQTEVTVGCNGLVKNVWIVDRGALPANVADCIAQTLRFASFPAHAVPEGVTFGYPIQYRY